MLSAGFPGYLMLHIVLHNPKIPPNTGNVIRLMANTGFTLHLIEPLGFDFETKQLRRAGLDYGDLANVHRHADFASFLSVVKPKRVFAVTTRGSTEYTAVQYQHGDVLLFGSETDGLPESVHALFEDEQKIRIPMRENNRSLNLSNSVAILTYEVWRQWGFEGGH